jgi:hypothetical protein
MTEPHDPIVRIIDRTDRLTEKELASDVEPHKQLPADPLAWIDEPPRWIQLLMEDELDVNAVIEEVEKERTAQREEMERMNVIVEWLLSDDTGSSSKSICKFMLGIPDKRNYPPPSDAADRGRCIRLLNLIPEWWVRLGEMAHIPSRESIVVSSTGVGVEKHGWKEQIELIKAESLTKGTE